MIYFFIFILFVRKRKDLLAAATGESSRNSPAEKKVRGKISRVRFVVEVKLKGVRSRKVTTIQLKYNKL